MKLKPIEQQVVAIVGASSGIGRETALHFAKKRAKVVVSARSESGLTSLVEEISQFWGEADDLRRFKMLMETGEIATTEGQPTGHQ